MTILLDQRDDGTLRLFIDGDLQFDSRDERIYHELLALPGLALAERRTSGPLRVLICGGGDGLTAREVLKSQRVAHIDLVDYDPTIIDLARTTFADLNAHSLDHIVTHVQVEDAWAFCERAARRGKTYHLIVVDLTLPQDVDAARLCSIDWYQRLVPLVGQDGIVAINAASPSATPNAYWSIYNSVRAAGLAPRPYHFVIPSFAEMGYGADWGCLLAASRPITAAELDAALPLAQPRQILQTPAQLRELFCFPTALADLRVTAIPARAGSPILLHYIYNSPSCQLTHTAEWDGLADEVDPAPLPAPDDGQHLLPRELQDALATPIGSPPDEEALFQRVLQLMPALHHGQTRTMITSFLADPVRFLGALDLAGLVEHLLRRAAELPHKLVAELRLLQRKLHDFVGNHAQLLRLGMRVVTIVTLVVIIANLTYPDVTYGKGGDGGTSVGHAYSGDTVRLAQPSQSFYHPTLPSTIATNPGFRSTNLGHGAAVDELGSLFPTRRYRYYPYSYGRSGYSSYRSRNRPNSPVVEDESAYRLTPETDILNDGKVVISLNASAYLLLDADLVSVVDQSTGEPILFLQRDPALIWRAAKEIERQQLGLQQTVYAKEAWMTWVGWLSFGPGTAGDQVELANVQAMAERLRLARESLGSVPTSAPELPKPAVAGAFEVFTGVWLLPDGRGLALLLPDGLAFMGRNELYSDLQLSNPLDERYPEDFRIFVMGYLQEEVKDRDATLARLNTQLVAEQADLKLLQQDQVEYTAIRATSPESTIVEYGTSNITLGEALRLTETDLARVAQRIALLQSQINTLPNEMEAAERLIRTFK